ncbi:hypothetical protein ACWEQO_22115 [Streptomyces sp. NPDC004051]
MISPYDIPQFTGDFDQLDKDVSGLRSDAIGIRNGGMDVHSRFQMLEAFYTAPEAEALFATTRPVMDGAEVFATKLETVADALDTYAVEARPLAKRLEQLKTDALAFTRSVEGDDDWTEDEKKVERNQRLINDVTATQFAFQEAERLAADKISAVVGGPRFVADDGSGLVERGTVRYGFELDLLEEAEQLPWGTPEEQTYEAWSWGWFGHGAKSFFWDGIYKDGIEAGVEGLWALASGDGEAWSGLKDVVTGIGLYTMTPYDAFMDWAVGPDEESEDEVRAKQAAKEFGKALVAWDMWQENPTRAAGTVVFNGLTLGAGPLAVASKAGKGGLASRTAGVVGKAGLFMDPVHVGLRATTAATGKLPKLSELTHRITAGAGASADAQRVHSVIELEDGSKVVIENGEFIPYDRHGHEMAEAARREPPLAVQVAPERTSVPNREFVGAGAGARMHDGPTATGVSSRAVDGSGTYEPARGAGLDAGGGSGHSDGAVTREGVRTGERAGGPGRGVGSSDPTAPAGDGEHGLAKTDDIDDQATADGDENSGRAPSDTDGVGLSSTDHRQGTGQPDFTRPVLPPGQAELSLRELRALRAGRHRYTMAEEIGRQMYGGGSERGYPVPTHDHPYYPVETPGGRKVDVPVDLPGGRTLAVEIKHYLSFRTIKLADGTNQVVKGQVPLSDGIKEQINKDLTLRRLDPSFDPRWVFMDAPPSQALRRYLIQARIIFIEYGPAPKK